MPEHSPIGTSASVSSGGPVEGTVVAERYRLVAPLATGGMATVWRAHDEILTRPVAVKILHAHLAADPSFVARFRREAVAAARLSHPSIVSIYDTSDDPESIVMELVEGRTLRQELDARGFLPVAEAIAIASGIAEALDIAHKAGLVHRDVKPANVLLSADGRLKVADFGIAKAAHSAHDADADPELPDLTSIGHMVGTAKYLAPEQVSGGTIDARTDVYALGAVLYEMVCGRPPFQGENDLATATARLHALPERPRSVRRTIPERLDAVIMRALATNADERYESAAAMWADLQATPVDADGAAPVVDATAVTEAPSFAAAERSWLVPALLVSMIAVALGLAWLLIGGTDARRDFFDLVDRVSPGGDESPDPAPLDGLTAIAYDPIGGDGEGNDVAPFAVDGDPATAWSTENYNTRLFGGLKDGVGLVVELGESRSLHELRVLTPDEGWSATVHVADSVPSTYAEWGEPAGEIADGAGGATVDLSGARGSYVLLWLTDLGDGPRFEFDLQELVVTAS